MCGKCVIPKKFSSCHPGFDPGSGFQFGFSRKIEAVYQDFGVQLDKEAMQMPVINIFPIQNFTSKFTSIKKHCIRNN
jgi:hypothetical protein